MRIKAIFPNLRARTVEGIALDVLKKAVRQVEAVDHYNGSDLIGTVSAKEFLRRLNAMPNGSEVAVMGGPNHAKRRFPCDTSFSKNGSKNVILMTHYLY